MAQAGLEDLKRTLDEVVVGGPGGANSLVDGVHDVLRLALRDGRIGAGTRLVEAELADTLSVSRTPVREALRRLEAEGLVRSVPKRGFIAAEPFEDVDHVFMIRERLEGLAAYLAAQEITLTELQSMQALQAEMEELINAPSPDVDRLVALNRSFHAVIHQASRSPRLVSMIERLLTDYMSYQVVSRYDAVGRRDSVTEHRTILDALWKREPHLADSLIQTHLERGRAVVTAEMRQAHNR